MVEDHHADHQLLGTESIHTTHYIKINTSLVTFATPASHFSLV